ncbi:MAG: chitobiase/beta-hexosaminidase C-terminal domain-containing protein [Myxococcota bacterium]
MVRASPPGGEFAGSTTVQLLSMVSDQVEIFYTTDGSPATSKDAKPYDGPLTFDGTTLLSYIAKAPDGTWSSPTTELYVAKNAPASLRAVARAIRLQPDDVIFFAWKAGDPIPSEQVVHAVSVGTEPVAIQRVELGTDPQGGFFSDPSAFGVTVTGPSLLLPGESIEIRVSYTPSEKLKSAQITIFSNELQGNGTTPLELWGRISPY